MCAASRKQLLIIFCLKVICSYFLSICMLLILAFTVCSLAFWGIICTVCSIQVFLHFTQVAPTFD